jgi:hypothetical protein
MSSDPATLPDPGAVLVACDTGEPAVYVETYWHAASPIDSLQLFRWVRGGVTLGRLRHMRQPMPGEARAALRATADTTEGA